MPLNYLFIFFYMTLLSFDIYKISGYVISTAKLAINIHIYAGMIFAKNP